jgi:hypothetical protein
MVREYYDPKSKGCYWKELYADVEYLASLVKKGRVGN